MRNLVGMSIENVIVHILDNRSQNKVLNDFEVELNEKTERIFRNHIINSINDEKTRVAFFESNGPNVVRDLSYEILQDTSKFIENSKHIANYLYDSMVANRSIAPANFAVCLYSKDSQRYIALLKMDFSEIIETQVEEIEGKKKIILKIKDTGIPNDKQKLRKCVFIKPYEQEDVYNIILLDKDNRDEGVASFFADNFLHCILSRTDRTNTRDILAITESFLRKNSSIMPMKLKEANDVLVYTLKHKDQLNVIDLANQIFEDDLKEKYLEEISEKIGDFIFNIDKEYVEKYIVKTSISTDTGIDIKLDLDTYNDEDKFEIRENNNGKVDIIIKDVIVKQKITK